MGLLSQYYAETIMERRRKPHVEYGVHDDVHLHGNGLWG